VRVELCEELGCGAVGCELQGAVADVHEFGGDVAFPEALLSGSISLVS
jgi:hypothetical protein